MDDRRCSFPELPTKTRKTSACLDQFRGPQRHGCPSPRGCSPSCEGCRFGGLEQDVHNSQHLSRQWGRDCVGLTASRHMQALSLCHSGPFITMFTSEGLTEIHPRALRDKQRNLFYSMFPLQGVVLPACFVHKTTRRFICIFHAESTSNRVVLLYRCTLWSSSIHLSHWPPSLQVAL